MYPTAGGYPLPLNQSSLLNDSRQVVLDMKDKIYYLNPSQTPVLTLLNALGKNPCKDVLFQWMEDEYRTMVAGKCKIEDAGYLDTTSAKYHFVKLTLSRAIERQAFNQSAYMQLVAGGSEHAGHIKDPAGNNESHADFQNNLFKVTLYGVDGTDARTLFVLSPNFYSQQESAVKSLINAQKATPSTMTQACANVLAGTWANPVDVITAYNEVWCVVNPLETTNDDPGSDWSAYSTSTYFNFKTQGPGQQKAGWKQGSGLGGEAAKRPRFNKNITQIWKDNISVTGTAMEVQLYGGETQYTRKAARIGAEHKLDIEYSLFTNGGYTGLGTETTTTRGLGIGKTSTEVAANTEDVPAIYTKNGSFQSDYQWDWDAYVDPQDNLFAFYDMMSAIMEDSDIGNAALMISQKMNNILHKLAMQSDNMQVFSGPSETVFGVRFNTWRMPDVDIKTVVHRDVLRGPYEDYACWLDFSQMELRPLGSRDTKLFQNVGSGEIDGRIDYYLTELGFEVRNESRHGVIKVI